MTDKEFIECFITERMQMHYSKCHGKPTAEECTNFDQLENNYNLAIQSLSEKHRVNIIAYYESIIDRLTEDATFFYQKGIKDGLILYKILTHL